MKRNKKRNEKAQHRNETKRNVQRNATPQHPTLIGVLRQYATFFSLFRNNKTATKQEVIISATEKRNDPVSDWDMISFLNRNEKFATLHEDAQLAEAQRQRRILVRNGIFRVAVVSEKRKYYYFTSEFLAFVKIISTIKND